MLGSELLMGVHSSSSDHDHAVENLLSHIKYLLHQQYRMMALSPDKVQQLELCLCPLTLQSDHPGQVKCTGHWRGSHCGCLSVQDVRLGQCQSYTQLFGENKFLT